LASGHGKQETVRTLVELGVDKEAKDKVRYLMMMKTFSVVTIVMMMMMTFSVSTIMIIVGHDKGDSR